MKVVGLFVFHTRYTGLLLAAGLLAYGFLISGAVSAQTIDPDLRPDLQRALAAHTDASGATSRVDAYIPAQARLLRAQRSSSLSTRSKGSSSLSLAHPSVALNIPATSAIPPGTPLTQILHTSQLSLSSSAGTDEQFVDRTGDLIADEQDYPRRRFVVRIIRVG